MGVKLKAWMCFIVNLFQSVGEQHWWFEKLRRENENKAASIVVRTCEILVLNSRGKSQDYYEMNLRNYL